MIVVFLIDTLQVGGAEKSILEIARRLKKCEPIVITLFSKKPDLSEEYRDAGIKVIELNIPYKNKLWLLKARKAFKKELKKINPDIVHAHLFKAELVARLSVSKRSVLVGAFVNDSYSQERYAQQTSKENFKLNIVRWVDAVTAKKAAFFTSITRAISESNSKALGVPVNNITTIYRGRDTSNFNVVQPVLTNEFIFLAVARLLKRKGYNELIEAFALALKGNSSIRLWIAGEGHDRKIFETLAQQLQVEEYISFLGNRNDVPLLLQKAHCFVFASHYEGQGGALVEAMLSGKPIIVSDIPVFKEQISENETGIFFQAMNEASLKEKMIWMTENYDKGKQLGENAHKVAIEQFDINNIAAQYDKFYAELVKTKIS